MTSNTILSPDFMEYSDEEIVERVLGGEKQLYELLVDRYQRPIYNLMLRYSKNREEAADLTQEAFFRCFDGLASFRSDLAFFPWLYRLALNVACDWSRKKKRRQDKLHMLRHEAAESGHEDVGRHMENRQERGMVQQALCHLPDLVREILLVRYRHGLSIREVAAAFNLSESAAKMRIKRGLAQLKAILEDGSSP